jgi:hypothetical protein
MSALWSKWRPNKAMLLRPVTVVGVSGAVETGASSEALRRAAAYRQSLGRPTISFKATTLTSLQSGVWRTAACVYNRPARS